MVSFSVMLIRNSLSYVCKLLASPESNLIFTYLSYARAIVQCGVIMSLHSCPTETGQICSLLPDPFADANQNVHGVAYTVVYNWVVKPTEYRRVHSSNRARTRGEIGDMYFFL